ncbi:hypothetical protein M404DRAFT_1007427 [Pisolithus tinctorius Marx 270]|uniref:Uncharacterized protein n=1 Tax=Pisolithus tinctorius Marx 270 TaxID=870435 RepID=A0A0C3NIF8_PISTI|nr:hypothetical protein M404DRAFT_1007427 [Pisolithus tinctorius Marx 270]
MTHRPERLCLPHLRRANGRPSPTTDRIYTVRNARDEAGSSYNITTRTTYPSSIKYHT